MGRNFLNSQYYLSSRGLYTCGFSTLNTPPCSWLAGVTYNSCIGSWSQGALFPPLDLIPTAGPPPRCWNALLLDKVGWTVFHSPCTFLGGEVHELCYNRDIMGVSWSEERLVGPSDAPLGRTVQTVSCSHDHPLFFFNQPGANLSEGRKGNWGSLGVGFLCGLSLRWVSLVFWSPCGQY